MMGYSIRRRIANDDLSPDEAEALEWEKAEVETTEAVSMRGILVPSPDGVGGLRTQPGQDDCITNHFAAFGTITGRVPRTTSGDCVDLPRNTIDPLPFLKDQS